MQEVMVTTTMMMNRQVVGSFSQRSQSQLRQPIDRCDQDESFAAGFSECFEKLKMKVS